MPSPFRAVAIGSIGEFTNGMKGQIAPYVKAVFPYVLQSMKDEDDRLRRNSTYTCGQLMLYGGNEAMMFVIFVFFFLESQNSKKIGINQIIIGFLIKY
jgi:hypothetical protein